MPTRLVYWMGLGLGLGTSCRGPVPVDTNTDPCLVEAPLPGTITVSPWCDGAQTPGGGEGGAGDLVLANAWFRAILRQPAHALTRPGIGGGTLVDVAPWGFRDRLYEAIPLVGESAIQPDTWEILADGLRIAGPLRPLHGGAAGGQRAEITWRISADSPRLTIEGATGLWLHTSAEQQPTADGMQGPAVSFVTDGAMTDDLGGPVIVEGLTHLEVWRTDERWSNVPGAIRVTGQANGATHLQLRAQGEERGSILLLADELDLFVPADIDAVRGIAADRAPSPWTGPGAGIDVSPGARGTLEIESGGTTVRPVLWSADSRGAIVAVTGTTAVSTGAGTVQLATRGLEDPAEAQVIEVPPNGISRVRLAATQRSTSAWKTLRTLYSDRDTAIRRPSAAAVSEAWFEGADAVILLSSNDVAERLESTIPVFPGSELVSSNGWRMAAFPWYPDPRFSARGALDPTWLTAAQAPAAMRGGPNTARATIADYTWLRQTQPPDTWPDAIRLPAPGDAPLAAWGLWLTLEDPPRPFGPVTRVRVSDAGNWGVLDVQRALSSGLVVAGTGPQLEVFVDGQRGPWLPEDSFELHALLTQPGGLDHLAIVGPEGLLRQWTRPLPREVVLELDVDEVTWIGWSEDSSEWVTTQRFLRPMQP